MAHVRADGQAGESGPANLQADARAEDCSVTNHSSPKAQPGGDHNRTAARPGDHGVAFSPAPAQALAAARTNPGPR